MRAYFLKLGISVLFLGLTGSGAKADWYYVKWGMTKAEAISSSNGEARPIVKADEYWAGCMFVGRQPFAVIPRKIVGEFEFKGVLCTPEGQDKVESVVLNADRSTNVNVLLRALVSQYGEPTARQSSLFIWNDTKTGNTVTFDGSILGKIEYKKLGGSGL